MTELLVTQHLAYWRTLSLGTRFIVEGRVAERHRGPSPELAAALAAWDGHWYWEDAPDGRWLVLVRETEPRRERLWLHATLLAVALLTTTFAGAAFGAEPSGDGFTLASFLSGLRFSVPLLGILLAHESGHYLAARRYRVDASLPFFIPFPPQLNFIGTMGAFIRLRSPVFDRRTLFDIGVAGPLAGVVVAIPVLVIGAALSTVSALPEQDALAHQLLMVDGEALYLGDSVLLAAIRAALAPEGVLALHPLAVAGWVGLLLTMLNLLPLAQLDGGHIAYALFGRRQKLLARGFWLVLVALGWWYWEGWWLWAAVGLLLGRGTIAHPRVVTAERGLGPGRRAVAYVAILIFLLTFMPVPFSIP